MSKTSNVSTAGCVVLIGALLLGALLLVGSTVAGEMDKSLEPPTVTSILQGMYEIRRSGDEVGTETFIRRVLSSNTVIVESTYDVLSDDGSFITGNNRLEFEEDSGFPKTYYSLRKTQSNNQERIRESTANMYANVVVWDNRNDDRDVRKVLELPTGCLFIEANIANHVSFVVNRFRSSRGGKQAFQAFDPLAGGMAKVAIEYIGEAAPDSIGTLIEAEMFGHYRYYGGEMSEADVYVSPAGLVFRIDVRTHNLAYILVSMDNEND